MGPPTGGPSKGKIKKIKKKDLPKMNSLNFQLELKMDDFAHLNKEFPYESGRKKCS